MPKRSSISNDNDVIIPPKKRSKSANDFNLSAVGKNQSQLIANSLALLPVEIGIDYISEKYGKPHELSVQQIEDGRRFVVPISGREYTLKVTVPEPALEVNCITESFDGEGSVYQDQKMDRQNAHKFTTKICWNSQRRGLQTVSLRITLAPQVNVGANMESTLIGGPSNLAHHNQPRVITLHSSLIVKPITRDGEDNKQRATRDIQFAMYKVTIEGVATEHINVNDVETLVSELARIKCAKGSEQKSFPIMTRQEVRTLVNSIDESLGADGKSGTKLSIEGGSFMSETRFSRFWEEVQKVLQVMEPFKEWFRAGILMFLSPVIASSLLSANGTSIGMFIVQKNGCFSFLFINEQSQLTTYEFTEMDYAFVTSQVLLPSRIQRILMKNVISAGDSNAQLIGNNNATQPQHVIITLDQFVANFCKGNGRFVSTPTRTAVAPNPSPLPATAIASLPMSPSPVPNINTEDQSGIHKLLIVTESLVDKILGGRNSSSSSLSSLASKTPTPLSGTPSQNNSTTTTTTTTTTTHSATAAAQALAMLPGHSPRIGSAIQRLQQVNDNLNQVLQLEALSARLFEFSVGGGLEPESTNITTPNLMRRPSTSAAGTHHSLGFGSPLLTRKQSVPFATPDEAGHQFFQDQL